MNDVNELIRLFADNCNLENAGPMKKYMRNQFSFLGIKTPKRKELMKEFYEKSGILKRDFQPIFVLALWDQDEREFQYAALHYIEKSLRKLQKEDLPLMEKLITTKSWWDTVDVLAPKPVGKIAAESSEVISETIEGWAYGNHLWLRRSAILFQLKYKAQTNEELLYRYIKQNAEEKEFFIQKAIGWALREYSKTNPQSVKEFIESNTLSNLSVREGSKYIKD